MNRILPPAAVLLSVATAHRAAGRAAQAADAYASLLAAEPDHAQARLAFGAMLIAEGDPAAALPHLRRAAASGPADGQAWHALGLALLLCGDAGDACAALAQGHRLDPANALCAIHLADADAALHRAAETLPRWRQALAATPGCLGTLCGLAACLAHCGRPADALDVLEAATVLHPAAVVPAALYADRLAASTRQADAEPALRRAMALDPANHDAGMALSVVLMRLHRYAEAETLLRALMAQGVAPLGPLCNLTTVLVTLGRVDDALAAARRAISLAPDHPAPRRALCNALPYHHAATGPALLQAARACSASAGAARPPPAPPAAFTNVPDPHRPLRLGLLSGTLRTHPVGWLTLPAFEALDPAAWHITCLSPHAPHDAHARRFAARADDWHDTLAMDDAQLAAHCRGHGIDILIDLGGYGDLGRLPACAHRCAPVQIKWVGMQNHSTGLAQMDWFVTDRWETPAGHEDYYSERLLVLDDGYVCYDAPAYAPPVAVLPALATGAVTFGCFNNLAKITPQVIAIWCDILRAVPSSRLILKTHQFNDADTRAALHAQIAAHGIDAARVILRGSSPHAALLGEYNDIDIVLDPFPYAGGLTTCEALWMGVPVITLPGTTFASRHSASHLSNIGLPNWIAADRAGYVASAIARAADLPALAALRAGLRARVAASPLCDAPRFAASLSRALRHAWADWCGRAPHFTAR